MATKTVTIVRDERYPDYDLYVDYKSKIYPTIEVDEELYKEYIEASNRYGDVQEKLAKLYAKANKKANS